LDTSAYVGDNVVQKTSQMKWYEGRTVLELLDELEQHRSQENKPLRLPLQDVYKFDDKRILAGRIESGKVAVGDELLFLPSKKTGVVKSIEKWNAPVPKEAVAGESIGIVLEDQIFVERGEMACRRADAPQVSRTVSANIFWMGDEHLQKGKTYLAKLTTQELECEVKAISRVINSSTLAEVSKEHHEVAKNEVAELELRFKKDVAFDRFDDIVETGRFVLVDGHRVCGGGIILKK